MKLAFVGFQHPHMLEMYHHAQILDGVAVVAACEENEGTRQHLMARGDVSITHERFDQMLDAVECDAVAVGDYFARRGSLILQTLARGKHVLVDKPVCTSLAEIGQIERICRERGLKLGCMLTMRDSGPIIGLRNLIRSGLIGDVQAISFGGQHPLLPGTRPSWYFEPGKHGGTINDIVIHAVDAIPWITGQPFTVLHAARTWNALAREHPHFRDGGQIMASLGNACGVLGDVSYFMPNSMGYSLPHYWRMTFWGEKGMVETSTTADSILVALDGEPQPRLEPLPEGNPAGYFKAFLAEIAGQSRPDQLTTDVILTATRQALTMQWAADVGAREVGL